MYWMLQVTLQFWTNQSALFHRSTVMLWKKLLMTLGPSQQLNIQRLEGSAPLGNVLDVKNIFFIFPYKL